MEDTLTLVFVCMVILGAFYFSQLWLSIIFVVVLLAILFSGSRKKIGSAQPGPQVRPIIVKRKYVGPESIYPKKMEIQVTSEKFGTGMPWSVEAPQKLGEGFGKFFKGLFSRKED